jgi:hypothetical protein
LGQARPGQTRLDQARPGYKCKIGRAILALGILGILMSVGDSRAEEPRAERELAYGGQQGLMEGMALGTKERHWRWRRWARICWPSRQSSRRWS